VIEQGQKKKASTQRQNNGDISPPYITTIIYPQPKERECVDYVYAAQETQSF